MATYFLSDKQRIELNQFPDKVDEEELIQYFTLSINDLKIIPITSASHTKLGFAISLCALRFLGFIPDTISNIPEDIAQFLAKQLNLKIDIEILEKYGLRAQTKSDHALIIEKHLAFRQITNEYLSQFKIWLLDRAMEHDRPTLLLKTATEKLKSDKIVRPTLVSLERLVGSVREQAKQKTYQVLSNILTEDRKNFLDTLLVVDKNYGNTLLTWLRQRATSHSPEAILTTLTKIRFLKKAKVDTWDLSILNVNRIKILNRLGKCSTNQALQRSIPEQRYPILVAFMHQTLEELTDEVVDLFDQALSQSYTRSKNSLKKYQTIVQEITNDKVRLLKIIGSIILDNNVSDPELRQTLYEKISFNKLQSAIDECDKLIRPENDKGIDYFAKRFQYLRQFIPTFIKDLNFQAIQEDHPILRALHLLREMNQEENRKIPDNAEISFINESWKRYVFQNGKIDRKFYELSAIWELRNLLRSGDVWVNGGRRYSNPEHYLIPYSQWQNTKNEACEFLQLSQEPEEQLQKRQHELNSLFMQLNNQFKKDNKLKIEDGKLIISPLESADEPEDLKQLRQLINSRLPKIDLPDLVMEVDSWVNFSDCFHHAGNQKLNKAEFPVYLYAAILGEATNLGPTAMADITDLNYERIVWHKNWLLRDETINQARTKLVNFQHQQELAQYFGDGTFSSSDGRRIPVAVKTTTARSFVKYFAFETGINLYSWTSNQYPQYGNKVTAPTLRESTFVLDAILDNETDLKIERHTTDTAGYTEIIFALFDLLGLRFEPRIKNLKDQHLYYLGEKVTYSNIKNIIGGKANSKIIKENWDDILRVTASLKKGWVSASLFISKIQALPRKSNLAKALQEYGKIAKTISILRYAISEEHRREIGVQLNKGEAVHDLQQFLHLGREGRLYARQLEEQENHFGCLNLLTNIVIIWNTVYLFEVIRQLKQEGYQINEENLKHLSPVRREHINPYGKYQFNLEKIPKGKLRDLNI